MNARVTYVTTKTQNNETKRPKPAKCTSETTESVDDCVTILAVKYFLWKIISIKMAYLMFTLRYFDVSGFLEVV